MTNQEIKKFIEEARHIAFDQCIYCGETFNISEQEAHDAARTKYPYLAVYCLTCTVKTGGVNEYKKFLQMASGYCS